MPESVEQLYAEHGAELAAALALSSGDARLAEELAHETVLRTRARDGASGSPADARVRLLRTAYGLLRRRTLRPSPRHAVADEHPILSARGLQAAEPLFAALDGLPPAARDAAVLCLLLGLPAAGTARILGVSETEVVRAMRTGEGALAPLPNAAEAFRSLVASARPIHEERLEDLEYIAIGGKPVGTYAAALVAVLLVVWFAGGWLRRAAEAPVRTASPPVAQRDAASAGAPASRATQPPRVVASAGEDGAGADASTPVNCAGCSIYDGNSIESVRVTMIPPPGRASSRILHLKATHTWISSAGEEFARQRSELWLDPANGDARYVETDLPAGTRTAYVRSGNVLTVLAPPEYEPNRQTVADASDPLVGPPQNHFFQYEKLRNERGEPGVRETTIDGRAALQLEWVGGRYGTQLIRVWIDSKSGMLLRERNYYVYQQAKPRPLQRHYIKYDRVERVDRDALPDDLFAPVLAPSRSPSDTTGGLAVDSPLAIPAAQLRRLGLDPAPRWPLEQPMEVLLWKHGGRRLFGQVWDGSRRDSDAPVPGVLDERFRFPTPAAARAFLDDGALDTMDGESWPRWEEKTQTVRLARHEVRYKVAEEGSGSMRRIYLFMFRSGSVVARIGVAGGEDLSRRQAFELVEAAGARMGATRAR